MSVTALSARTGRHTSHPSGPGRAPAATRRAPVPPAPAAPVPALTVTLAIPLTTDALTPQAHRLLEIVRELVAMCLPHPCIHFIAHVIAPFWPSGGAVRFHFKWRRSGSSAN